MLPTFPTEATTETPLDRANSQLQNNVDIYSFPLNKSCSFRRIIVPQYRHEGSLLSGRIKAVRSPRVNKIWGVLSRVLIEFKRPPPTREAQIL